MGGDLAGEIVNANGLILGVAPRQTLIAEAPPGIIIAAAGPSNVFAEVVLSCEPGTIFVAGGTVATFDCGSLIADVRLGEIRVPLTGGADIVAGRASKVKIAEFDGENFAVKNNSSAAPVSIISENGPSASIEPGGFRVVGPTAVPVQIDVRPGGFPNPINRRSAGGTPVAILGSALIDVRQIILSTIELERAPVLNRRNGSPMAAISDIDGDGFPDLVVHVVTALIDAHTADPDVAVVAKTSGGKTLIGMDVVKLTPP